MRKIILLAGLMACTMTSAAQELRISTFQIAGPYPLQAPVKLNSTDVSGKAFDAKSLLSTPLRLESVKAGTPSAQPVLTKDPQGRPALHLAAFSLENHAYTKATIAVKGLSHHELYVDGQKLQGTDVELQPARHEVIIKALTTAESTDSLQVTVTPATEGSLRIVGNDSRRTYTIQDVLHARLFSGVALSPDGRWMTVSTRQTRPGGATESRTEVREVSTGRVVDERSGVRWMPRSNRYFFTRREAGGQTLVAVDPQSHAETVLARDLPEGYFEMTATEDRLVFTLTDEGPKERPDVYEVIHPDDRQPGWRTRSHLAVYDLRTGLMQPLTFGHANVYLYDLSRDGRKALIGASYSQLGKRPTELISLYQLDLSTLAIDTLFTDEGFVSRASFSPDGRQVLLSGSPEAFGGVGRVTTAERVPNMTEGELFILDVDGTVSGQAASPTVERASVQTPTRAFDPSVGRFVWSAADGIIYFTAEDKDSVNLFCLNPRGGDIRQLPMPEELMKQFDIAADAPVMAVAAQSASNSDRLYVLDLKNILRKGGKAVRLAEDLSAQTLQDVELGQCLPFTYVNPDGDSICCRYYLPPHFDAAKRYPMIVNYYGGCSPTSRNFESRYPQHAYAALGYVVLVVNPRGATGFGQQWASHHVNTAGEGVAEDIIGAVKAFCGSHNWVNEKKIGCIGASYGGFMTQYLQTRTDLFAAAISHAGISDHTSYWGEGYWGYTYSEVSMAGSYPWTRKDLYVDQSPLFNADKIHTPLLFLHGDADHNVPVGESIQMFTALKLLQRPTAMVLVKDQDHHITDYEKRLRWQQTIWAWFARWLKDEPQWWDAMYPEKTL